MLNGSDAFAQPGGPTIKGGFPGQAPVCQLRFASRAGCPPAGAGRPARRCRPATGPRRHAVGPGRHAVGPCWSVSPPVRGPPGRRPCCPRTCCRGQSWAGAHHRPSQSRPRELSMVRDANDVSNRLDPRHQGRCGAPPDGANTADPVRAAPPASLLASLLPGVLSPDPHRMSRHAHKESGMLAIHAIHSTHQNLMAIRALVTVLAISGVIFWRAAIKILIAIGVVLVTSGAVAFLQGVLHVIK